MGTVISNLKAKFGVDSGDFRKGLKDGEKAVADFKGTAGGQLNQLAEMFGINMGAVSDAVGTAGRSLNFVGQSFKGAAAGGSIFKIAINGVKIALLQSGIGAIVVALGTLIAYFSKSGKGADQFARILAQVKSVLNNVIDRLAVFGKGVYEIATGKFKQGWESMKGAFKGIGEEIKNDWTEAGKLADRLDALDDREIDLITSLEERKAKAAELRLMAKEETEDQKKKLEYLNQASALYKSVYADQISVERERLAIMKEQLAISAKDPTDEQRREIREQEAKINALYREQAQELKGLTREKNGVTAAVKEELDLEVKKLQTLQLIDDKADISNIKMPDFSQVSNALVKLNETRDTIRKVTVDISNALEEGLEGMAENIGAFLGALASGDAKAKDFGAVMAASFADLAITIGKLAIASAITVGVLDKMLKNPAAWPVALAAGIALVAVGTAVKGSLAKASGGGASVSSGAAAATSGVAGTAQQNFTITLQGELKAKGTDLVYVVEQENRRKRVTTGG